MSQKFGFLAYRTGAPLALDPDPNVTAPTVNVFQLPGRTNIHNGSLCLVCDAALTAEVYVYNNDSGTWVPIAQGAPVSGLVPLVIAGAAVPNAHTFIRVTANGGGATFVGAYCL